MRLTGEACAIGLRILCDLTVPGERIIRRTLGLPHDTAFDAPWNSLGHSSVLLPYDLLEAVSVVALFDNPEVWAVCATNGNGVFGCEKSDYYVKEDVRNEGSNGVKQEAEVRARDPVAELREIYGSSFKRSYRNIGRPIRPDLVASGHLQPVVGLSCVHAWPLGLTDKETDHA